MLKSLNGFRHIQTDNANLEAVSMPLFEVFVGKFLSEVDAVVKRGLRSDYVPNQGNLLTLRGKLLVSAHIRQNLIRPERFHTVHDEFSINRPENRLLHSALRRVLTQSTSRESLRLAQELCFRFADVPESEEIRTDSRKVRLDRGMAYYQPSLAWARLILEGQSPLTGIGDAEAPSMLFPMEAVFDAYVEKHIARSVAEGFNLKSQARTCHLVKHQNQDWFQLKPDLLLREGSQNRLVLDAKWKLLDGRKANAKEKYGLSQSDFYQLYAYGHHYLGSEGDVLLIYPMTGAFKEALPPFTFPQAPKMKLWVLPFDLEAASLVTPSGYSFCGISSFH
jgi:5-methylcytosine-specific restriction enzyme subunit McrC